VGPFARYARRRRNHSETALSAVALAREAALPTGTARLDWLGPAPLTADDVMQSPTRQGEAIRAVRSLEQHLHPAAVTARATVCRLARMTRNAGCRYNYCNWSLGSGLPRFSMPRMFRIMKKADDNLPIIGSTATSLGIRVGEVDVDAAGNVVPNDKGMSVNPAWRAAPISLIPRRLKTGGRGSRPRCGPRRRMLERLYTFASLIGEGVARWARTAACSGSDARKRRQGIESAFGPIDECR
jgi:hypothetical protein